jgi:hypothetical protein
LKNVPATNMFVTKGIPPTISEKTASRGYKKNFGTGFTSTLLSSQRTTTHQPQPPSGDRSRGNFPTLPGRTSQVKSSFGPSLIGPRACQNHRNGDQASGFRQTGRRHHLRGATPARLLPA